MDVGKRIRAAREKMGLTRERLALQINKNPSTIYRYECGEIANLSVSTLFTLAEALHTTTNYLLTGEEDFVPDEIPDNIFPVPKVDMIPLLGAIACGLPSLAEENIEEYIPCPKGVRADFCLRCKGDSMVDARIYDGDIVYIRRQPTVENGQIAAVLIDDSATLKKVYQTPNFLTLKPANPKYDDIILEATQQDEIRILGKAVGFFSAIEPLSNNGLSNIEEKIYLAAGGGNDKIVTISDDKLVEAAKIYDSNQTKKTPRTSKKSITKEQLSEIETILKKD